MLSAIAPVGLLTIAISWIVLVLVGFCLHVLGDRPDMGADGAVRALRLVDHHARVRASRDGDTAEYWPSPRRFSACSC